MPISEVYNEDNMIGMARYPDKFFDLAIVDPPYGDGQNFNFRFKDSEGFNGYDNISPPKEYFDSLFRVSKNQIIWGGNYFADKIPVSRCWLCWFKNNPLPDFSDIELAWTSFNKVSKIINLTSYGFRHADIRNGDQTIHPTQKPVFLYMHVLKYAKPGDKILDTHMGSQSSRIASFKMGFDYYGWELGPKYFADGNKRFKEQTMQLKLF